MTHLTINGNPIDVPTGTTVLRAAEKLGITIPTLCDHPDLTPYGGCRLCLVEVKGARGLAASCALAATEGMEVTTESTQLTEARRGILELLLYGYHDSGYADGQKEETQFMRWVRHYGLDPAQHQAPQPYHPVDSDSNPVVWVDMNKCILCNRCIRACAEVQGRFVWALTERGFSSHIMAGAGAGMLPGRCESCGACVAYCPTGALDNKPSIGAGVPDKLVTTTCSYCGVGCQFDLNIKDGKIIRVTSNPQAPVNGMHLCVKGRYGYDYVHHPERLTKPKVRRYLLAGMEKKEMREQRGENGESRTGQPISNHRLSTHPIPAPWDWVETDWETALNITASKLRATRDNFGPDSVGILTSAKCTNEENYLMNKLARQVIGTNNLDHCARL